MSYMSKLNGRGRFGSCARPSLYDQWGIEARKLVSTGKYRGDTGRLEDLYLVGPSERSRIMEVGMTVGDLVACAVVVSFIFGCAWLVGPGMDSVVVGMGW